MKAFLLLVVLLLSGRPFCLQAGEPYADAAAVAVQRDAEERYKRLAADVQTVLDTQEVIQKRQEEFRQRLDRMAEDIRNLKEEHSRSSGNVATRDELRKLIEKLKEQLDEQREADKKLILANIRDLAKTPSRSRTRAGQAQRQPPPARNHGGAALPLRGKKERSPARYHR